MVSGKVILKTHVWVSFCQLQNFEINNAEWQQSFKTVVLEKPGLSVKICESQGVPLMRNIMQ